VKTNRPKPVAEYPATIDGHRVTVKVYPPQWKEAEQPIAARDDSDEPGQRHIREMRERLC